MAADPSIPSFLFKRQRPIARNSGQIHEAVIGIVVEIQDSEQLGRVKVQFPTLPDDDVAHWATVRSLGAGNDRGWYFLPELNDEVVVMFEHGDIRRPVVIGAVWNGKDAPPETSTKCRVLQSREGSRIEFDDEAETLTISDGTGIARIVLDKESITIEAMSGDICLQAPTGELALVAKDIEIRAGGNVLIHSNTTLTISGQTKVSLEGASAAVAGPVINVNGTVVPAMGTRASTGSVPDPIGS